MQASTEYRRTPIQSTTSNETGDRLQFEILLTDIAANFVNLPVKQIDAAIVGAQRRICQHLGFDRSVLWQLAEGTFGRMQLTHIHDVSKGYLPHQFDAQETFPWGFGQVFKGKIFTMARTDDLPSAAQQDREAFTQWGVKSCVFTPLKIGGKVNGALSFCLLHQETTWHAAIIQRLQLVAQIFTNALIRKQNEEHLEALRQFEILVADISTHFINLPSDRVDAEIQDAQRRICKSLKVDLSSLWQWSHVDPRIFTITHLHSPPQGPAFPHGIDAQEALPWIFRKVHRGEKLIVSTQEMPPEAARDRETRRQFGVTTSVILPLSTGGGPIVGVLSFDSLDERYTWIEPLVERLRLIAQIFANALARKRTENELAFNRRLDTLVTDISTQFVNLPADRIDAQIEDAQRRICECIGVDLSVLWQWSDSAPHFMTVTHLHSPPEGPEKPEGIDALEAFPYTFKQLMRGETIARSTTDLPVEAARDVESLNRFGVKSDVVFPLSAGGGPMFGILSFDTLTAERSWPEPLLEKLRLIAQLFANALARKRNDLQLRESRARLSMATESAEVGLWVMEADTGSVWVTPQTRTLFQFAENEVLDYARFQRKIDPAYRERVEQAVQAALDSGEPLDIEFPLAIADGDARWIRAGGKRLPGAHGQGFRLMGASKDISQRKQMEQQLRNQLAEIKDLKDRLENENTSLRKKIELQHVNEEIVSRSQAMQQILDQAEQVARTDATVLIEGETGTGKELLAKAVHRLSERCDRLLVTVNCASLPPTLVESELFGREKGAYTGALTRMTGRFETAHGATLFLDEIGELPMEVQAKLLRVLEQGSFERLGSAQSVKVNVRVIAATNKNLEQQVEGGRFRKDLFYRLNVFPIRLPPLRERPEDIPPLVWHFVRQYENKMGRRIDHVTRQCMNELQGYGWPGNVRELRNVIERALIVCRSRTLEVHPPNGTNQPLMNKTLNLDDTERRHIVSVLEQTGWRIAGPDGAAQLLGLKRTTLQSKMKRLGIRRPPR